MAQTRERYKVQEFAEARQALDNYHTCLTGLAFLIRQRQHGSRIKQEKLDVGVEALALARERLRRAVEGLGFEVMDKEKERKHETD